MEFREVVDDVATGIVVALEKDALRRPDDRCGDHHRLRCDVTGYWRPVVGPDRCAIDRSRHADWAPDCGPGAPASAEPTAPAAAAVEEPQHGTSPADCDRERGGHRTPVLLDRSRRARHRTSKEGAGNDLLGFGTVSG